MPCANELYTLSDFHVYGPLHHRARGSNYILTSCPRGGGGGGGGGGEGGGRKRHRERGREGGGGGGWGKGER